MSQNIVDVWDGVQNTNSWVHDGDVERSAVDIVELASSVAGYSAGAQAAAAAASGYADTASGAVASIGTAATDAVQAVQNEGTAQISALVDAGGVQTGLIGSAGAAQLADIVTSGGIQISSVGSAGAAQITAITSAGGAQVALVSAAGTSATGDLAGVTAAQSAALVSAGGYQSGLISTVGSAQIAAVQAEGGMQIAAVQLAASAQVSSATVAAMSAGAAASTAQGAASVASGYALTASSYMTSAGGYASAASDSATAAQASAESIAASAAQIQTNADNITALETKTDITNKNVSNIQALLNGTLYREETDSTAAYSKAIPTGAMPYASVDMIGGGTVVWNQWVPTPTNMPYVFNGVTFALQEDGSIKATGTVTEGASFAFYSFYSIPCVQGHVYLVCGCPTGGSSSTYMLDNQLSIGRDYGNGVIGKFNGTITQGYVRIFIYPAAGEVNLIWKPRFLDLTLMFGAGNEPATVAEFEAMFPSINPAYNAGELKSAGVTEAVSEGKNLLAMKPWYYGADFYNRPLGTQLSSNAPSLPVIDNGDGSFSFTVDVSWRGAIFIVELPEALFLQEYTFKATISASGSRVTTYLLDENYKVLHVDNNTNPTQNWSQNYGGAFTSYPMAKYLAVAIGSTTSEVVTITNPTICKSEYRSYDYTSYRSPVSLSIPSAVQSLPGYGWSAGTVYNYVDYARKVYVQNVGSVDLGTLTWTNYLSGSNTQRFFSNGLNGVAKKPESIVSTANILSTKYTSDNIYNVIYHHSDKVIACGSGDNTVANILIWDSALQTLTGEDFKTAMSGVMLYYELATPIETDISEYLTGDNLINVEAGGTLTFRNQHGDDFRLPVPNEETYLEQATPELPTTDGTYTLQCTVTDGTPSVTWVTA